MNVLTLFVFFFHWFNIARIDFNTLFFLFLFCLLIYNHENCKSLNEKSSFNFDWNRSSRACWVCWKKLNSVFFFSTETLKDDRCGKYFWSLFTENYSEVNCSLNFLISLQLPILNQIFSVILLKHAVVNPDFGKNIT